MPILAVIDIEDDGSLKIQNFRDQVEGLNLTLRKSREEGEKSKESSKQQGDALSRLTDEVRKQHTETLRMVQGLNLISKEMRAGNTATKERIEALKQLAAMSQQNNLLSNQHKASLASLAQTMQVGSSITKQQAAAIQGATAAANSAVTANAGFAQSLGNLQAQAAALASVLGAAGLGYALKSYLTESFNIAARNEVLSTSMLVVAKNSHRSAADMEVQVQSIRKLGITTKEARGAVLDFAQANLKLSDASKLARVAQDLAVVGGMNSSEAFNRLTTAIQVQQPIMLRSFGIVSGLDEIYGKYARSINKTVQEMNSYDKRMAFMNRIMEEGTKVAGAYELSMNDVGKMIGSNARFTEELQNKIGQALLPVVKDLVVAFQKVMTVLSALNPETMRWITAVLAGGAAMVSLLASLSVAVGNFAAILSVLKNLNPWVVAISVAVGLLTAAWIGWRAESEYDVKAATEAVAMARTQRTAVQDLEKAVGKKAEALREARKAGDDTKAATDQLNNAVIKLNASVPGAVSNFDALTGAFSVEKEKIAEVIEGYDKLIKKRAESTGIALKDAVSEKDALLQAYGEVAGALAKGSPVKRLSELSKEAMATVQRNTSDWSRFTGSLNKDLTSALETFLVNADAKLKTLGSTIAGLSEGLSAQSSDGNDTRLAGLRGSIETIAGSESKLRAYLGKINTTWAEFNGANEDQLREIEQNVRGLVDKDAQNLQKWTAAYEKTFKNITQTAETTGADFAAVRAALNGVGQGTDEYAARLLRAKGVLDSLAKSTPAIRKEFADLQKHVENLQETGLEETFRKWGDKASEAAQAIEQVLSEDRGKDMLEVAERVRASDRQMYDERISNAREITLLERELTDRRVEGTLTGVQKEIQANNRYYEDKRIAIEEDIRQRQLVMSEEARQLEMTRKGRDRELEQTIARAKQRFRVEVETATAVEKATQAIKSGRSAKSIEEDIRNIKDKYNEFLDAQRAIQQKHNDQMYADEKGALDRKAGVLQEYVEKARGAMSTMEADNVATNKRILRDYNFSFQLAAEYAADFTNQVINGLADIITGAKSFEDVFVGIWRSIQSSVTGIINNIVKTAVNGLLGIGTGGIGGRAGMSQALGGLFGMGSAAAGGATSLGTIAGGSPWAMTAYGASGGVAGGAGAMGAGAPAWMGVGGAAIGGGVAGYGVGRLFNSRKAGAAGGALAGAGTGALIGTYIMPGLGTAAGAVIGGVAGAIGGAFGGGSSARSAQKSRDQWFDQSGGIDELIKVAEKYNISLDKVMDARRVKDVQKAIEDWSKAIQDAEKAAELKKLKEGLMQSEAQVKAMGKAARLVGYDMRKLYDAKTIEEFNKEQERLNELLEFQQQRLAALNRAATGLNDRVAGAAAKLEKGVTDAFKDMSPDRRKHLDEYYARAKEQQGFEGSQTSYLLKNGVKEGILTEEELDRLKKAIGATKEEFGRLGAYATAVFANILKETGDLGAAMEAVGPALDTLVQMRDELGIEVSGAFQKLLDLRKAITDNADVMQSLSGITNLITGLGEAGAMSAELMNTFGADLNSQWETLKARGVDANTALMMMQPSLQALYEAQKKFGFSVDETTQKMIDMGLESGIIGDDFMDVNERIFDVLLLIAETLGADIPDAFKKAKDAAKDAADKTEGGIVDSNTELEDQRRVLRDVGNDWKKYGDDVVAQIERINRATIVPPGPPGTGTGGGGEGGGGEGGGPAGDRGTTVVGGTQHVTLVADGRTLAKVTVPFMPEVVQSFGVRR